MNAVLEFAGLVLVASAAWYVIRWYRVERHFVWKPLAIRADIEPANSMLGRHRHLHLRQSLPPGESGWTGMRLAIPDAWTIAHVSSTDKDIALVMADGTERRLNRRNVGKLSFAILDGGDKTEDELQTLWNKHSPKRAA